ncbi:MAG: hypothetical protein ACKOBW_06060 [Planctomycetota bacterium]
MRRKLLAIPLSLTLLNVTVPAPPASAEETLEERRARLKQLAPDELWQLAIKQERFQQLPPARQADLRKFHGDLQTDPQADKLQEILNRYHEFLQTLPAAQRAELLSLSAEERVARIRKIQQDRQKEDERRQGGGRPIDPADQKAILDWLDQLAIRHETEFTQNSNPRFKEFLEQITDERRRRLMLIGAALRTRGESSKPWSPSEQEVQELVAQLSPNLQRDLESRKTAEERLERVQELIRWSFFSLWQPSAEDLERFYSQDLSVADRDWLDAMPRERFQRELRKLYAERMGRRGGEGPRPPFPFGFPGRGPGHRPD